MGILSKIKEYISPKKGKQQEAYSKPELDGTGLPPKNLPGELDGKPLPELPGDSGAKELPASNTMQSLADKAKLADRYLDDQDTYDQDTDSGGGE